MEASRPKRCPFPSITMGVEEMVAMTKSKLWGSDNRVSKGVVDETRSSDTPDNKKGSNVYV